MKTRSAVLKCEDAVGCAHLPPPVGDLVFHIAHVEKVVVALRGEAKGEERPICPKGEVKVLC